MLPIRFNFVLGGQKYYLCGSYIWAVLKECTSVVTYTHNVTTLSKNHFKKIGQNERQELFISYPKNMFPADFFEIGVEKKCQTQKSLSQNSGKRTFKNCCFGFWHLVKMRLRMFKLRNWFIEIWLLKMLSKEWAFLYLSDFFHTQNIFLIVYFLWNVFVYPELRDYNVKTLIKIHVIYQMNWWI